MRAGVSLETPQNWVEFLLDAFHCPDLPHGYPTPASPLRFRPAQLALRGRARAPRPCRAPCSPPRQGHIVTAIHISLSLPHLTAAIDLVRARVPLGAAALTSYSPEDDHDQGVCRAAFAAIDAIVANGA